MLGKLRRLFWRLEDRQRIAIALGKGALMPTRRIDLRLPETWEWSAFSQNGEDGILDVLCGQLRHHSRYFFEIGAGDGIDNNTAWLAIVKQYGGLMIEGDPEQWRHANQLLPRCALAVECLHCFVTRGNVATLADRALYRDPDVCSLDIDGNDYHIATALLDAGLRPRIFVVEYNSAYGPEQCLTIPYAHDFRFTEAHPSRLYYGVSIAGWRAFFAQRGYRFITVERNGVNAFFVDPAHFDAGFLDAVQGSTFAENRQQCLTFRESWPAQFERIRSLPLIDIQAMP